jgi:hypothetical protein
VDVKFTTSLAEDRSQLIESRGSLGESVVNLAVLHIFVLRLVNAAVYKSQYFVFFVSTSRLMILLTKSELPMRCVSICPVMLKHGIG